MNLRAIGCGAIVIAAFLLIGIWGISRVGNPAECPDRLPYQPAAYAPVGEPGTEPILEGVDEPLVLAGRAGFGLAGWPVWVEADRVPAASDEPLPQRIVLDCGDGTFQAYQRPSE